MPGGDPRGFVVFDFEVPREELMRRLSGRRWCPKCQATYHVTNQPPKRPMICDVCGTGLLQRDDDTEAVVARRLHEYDERTAAADRLLPHAHADDRRSTAIAPQETVFQDLLQAVEVRA